MTTGYLWTEQFPESSLPVEEGRPQSMEFQKESVQGQWEYNYDKEMDFFIINDAIIQKICILGDDVEPCFEGASVTAPDVSTKFTLDDNFRHTLYSMMQDLKSALNGGGQQMENIKDTVVEEVQTPEVETEYTQEEEKVTTEVDNTLEDTSAPADYVKKEEEDEKEQKADSEDKEEADDSEEDTGSEDKEEDDDKDKKAAKKYELLEAELQELKDSYSALQNQYEELVKFKTEIDNQNKDALIAEFYMLSDEDKADVISNKEKYTLDEIKSKLSVICFDKKISFNTTEEKKEDIVSYTINTSEEDDSLPEWVKAVKEQEKFG